MKRHIFLIVIALFALITMAACQDKAVDPFEISEPEKVEGVYQITRPGHLLYMAQNPTHDYALAADIDMQGRAWEPIADFSGNLNGVIHGDFNYTISNMTIPVTEGSTDTGFCRVLSGTISNVIFENITIVSNTAYPGNLGIVAGQCKTKLADVDVTGCVVKIDAKNANVGLLCGKLEAEATGCQISGVLDVSLGAGQSYIGGGIGYVTGEVSNFEARTTLTVSASADTSGATGGVLGYAGSAVTSLNYGGHIKVTAGSTHAAAALVGQLENRMTASYNCARSTQITGAAAVDSFHGAAGTQASVSGCLIRDLSNIEETLSANEYALRKKVVDYMYQLCTIRWSPTVTLTYSDNCGGKENNHAQIYEAGQIYFGLPYTHYAGSLEKFTSYLNADGTVSSSVPAGGWAEMLGNDCADAVYWSWAQISSEVSFTLTKNALCMNGTYPVGGYDGSSFFTSKDVCDSYGAQAMYEIYAHIQMGDALLYAPGHIRMAAEASYVFRNPDGTINPDKSYVLGHDQGAGTGAKQIERHTTCNVYRKYTFTQLFNGNYVPITIKAFENGAADEVQLSTTNTDTSFNGVGKGTVKCNYRINGVIIRIWDEKGNAVMDSSYFPSTGTHMTSTGLSNFRNEIQSLKLKSGKTYTYELIAIVAGEEHMVQTFTFKK